MSDLGAEEISDMTTESQTVITNETLAESVNILNDLVEHATINLDVNSPVMLTNENAANLNNYKNAFFTIFELSEEELNRIEEHMKNKIVHHGENFLQQHETLKSNYEKFKIEYEQRFIELEADFNESQSKLGIELKNAQLYRIKASENGKRILSI